MYAEYNVSAMFAFQTPRKDMKAAATTAHTKLVTTEARWRAYRLERLIIRFSGDVCEIGMMMMREGTRTSTTPSCANKGDSQIVE